MVTASSTGSRRGPTEVARPEAGRRPHERPSNDLAGLLRKRRPDGSAQAPCGRGPRDSRPFATKLRRPHSGTLRPDRLHGSDRAAVASRPPGKQLVAKRPFSASKRRFVAALAERAGASRDVAVAA